jgi:hypothetical protein
MLRLTALSLSFAVTLTAHAAIATAEDGDAPNPAPFALTDRVDDTSHVVVSFGDTLFTQDGADIDIALRADLHAQYTHVSGFGGYASMPLSYLSGGDDSATALGDLELGGAFVLKTKTLPVVLRAGVLLPTADDDFEGLITNFLTIGHRLTDLAGTAPNTTWLRASASPIYRSGRVILRTDVGVDVPIAEGDGVDADPLLRLNVGAGYDVGPIALGAEFITMATLGDVGDGGERFLHTVGVTGRYTGSAFMPGLSFAVPLDDSRSDQYTIVLDVLYKLPQ